MPRALARAVLADLRHHRLQTALVFVILVAATLALSLAVMVQRLTAGPFDRLMRETNGAHVWFTAESGVDLASIAALDGVSAVNGPFPLANAPLAGERGGPAAELGIDLLAQPAVLPPAGRPLVVEGRWLEAGDEIVLDPQLARFFRLRPGDTLTLAGPDGPIPLSVAGFAMHIASWQADGDGLSHRPAGYVLPETLGRIAPDRTSWRSVLGVRLRDPSAGGAFAAEALAALGGGAGVRTTEWQDLRDAATADAEINVVLLGVFSVFALLAGGLVIANAVAGRVLAQYREIGLLKAVGFTPGGVLVLFLIQNLAIGLAASGLGLLIGALLAPLFEDDLSALLQTTPVASVAPLPLLRVLLAVEGAVALATIVPAVRAAKVSTVQAITVGFTRVYRDGSRLARAAARLGLPLPAVIGLKDVFARPLRAWVTVAALALTVVTMTFSLGLDATMRSILDHPERWGMPYDLVVTASGVPAAEVERLLTEGADVESFVGRLELEGRADGSGATFAAIALAGDVGLYDAAVPEGRLFAAPGEAVVGQALLDTIGLAVGHEVRVWVDGAPLDLRIVGRVVDTEDDGKIMLFGLDTYRAAADPAAVPTEYGVQLEPGAFVFGAMRDLSRASNGRVRAFPAEIGAEDEVVQIRSILLLLNLILVVIGVVNLLSTTMLGVRERVRDVGILKAIGMTPAEVVRSVLVGVGALTVLAVAVGIPLGLLVTRLLFAELGRRVGVGSGLGVMPGWLGLATLPPAAVLIGVAGGIVPARRAAGLRVTEALRYE